MRRRRVTLLSVAAFAATSLTTVALLAIPASAATAPGGSFTGVTPARLLDTRSGIGTTAHVVPAGGSVTLTVAGRGGVPATGVGSVVLNVTVTGSNAGGYVTVYPAGTTRPTVSNLNFKAGQTVANLVTVAVSPSGQVVLYAAAQTHIIADVTGWFSTAAGASDHAGLFHPLRPSRIADSRSSTGITTPGPNTTRTLQVAGKGGVPATGVSAVVLNLTVAGPTAGGYVTAFPAGVTRPTASTINFVTKDVRANRVIVALGAGKVSFYNANGSTPLVVDVVGWFTDDSAAPDTGGAYFVGMSPVRIVDTRKNLGDLGGPIPAGQAGVQHIASLAGIPSGSGAVFPVAVVGNLTAVAGAAGGYLTAFPPGFGKVEDSVPKASDLNFAAHDVVPNMIVTQLHAGALGIYNSSGTTNVVLDVSGYFALPVPALSLTAAGGTGNDLIGATLSSNGRYLAVVSAASNLVSGDTNQQPDVFLVDRNTNAVTRVSVSTGGAQADGPSWEAVVSDDGRYVAFTSDATNLVSGDTNAMTDVFVRDTVANTTTRVNVGPGGVQADGMSFQLSISHTGTRVLFTSDATNLVTGDTNGAEDEFLADLSSGQVSRVSVDSAGNQGNQASVYGVLSGDGNHAAFISSATNLVSGDTNGVDDVFVRDLGTGTTTRQSVATGGAQATADPSLGYVLNSLSMSDDGNLVVFAGFYSNLVSGDTNGVSDVFIRNVSAGTTTRITAPGNVQADGDGAAISGDGSTIIFTADSPLYSPIWRDSFGDTMYVLRLGSGTITPIRGYDYFMSAELTADGNTALVFSSVASLNGEPNSQFGEYLLPLS